MKKHANSEKQHIPSETGVVLMSFYGQDYDKQDEDYKSGADLGFYQGGCPIYLKGAPEVERRRRRGCWGLGRGLCPLHRKVVVCLT